ncbi:MAG: 50S ribosomal protein L3 [Candidatus Campbellbacteria bacterium]|nr:50S ribosomal protein L3 [Candidatus Campbellbacteria bacterium]
MKFLLGKKEEMTQLFDDDGVVHPVTMLSLEPIIVTKIFDTESRGYSSVQVGYGNSPKKSSKESFKGLKEFRMDDTSGYKEGNEINTGETFKEGDMVRLSSVSKGKGFQGVVKRHGFHGGPRTHGQRKGERIGGAIGGGLQARVPKGKKMPGRMGGDRVTIKKAKIVKVEDGKIYIRGSVPGSRGTLVEIRGI